MKTRRTYAKNGRSSLVDFPGLSSISSLQVTSRHPSASNQTQNPSSLSPPSVLPPQKKRDQTAKLRYTILSYPFPKWISPSSSTLPLSPLPSASFLPPSHAATSTTASMSPFVAALSPPPQSPPQTTLLPPFSAPRESLLAYSP